MEANHTSLKPPIENEAFWKHHHELFKSSGMKRSDYCRENNLNYMRFGYWINRWNRFKNDKEPIGLISVKLKSDELPAKQKILCTLNLKDGEDGALTFPGRHFVPPTLMLFVPFRFVKKYQFHYLIASQSFLFYLFQNHF